jgi:hypothetical protein
MQIERASWVAVPVAATAFSRLEPRRGQAGGSTKGCS